MPRVGASLSAGPRRALPFALALLGTLTLAATTIPGTALAHGPTAPVATNYLARIDRTPAGVQAKVIDGYLRMWMRVAPARFGRTGAEAGTGTGVEPTVVVLDYRGAPYLRFSPSGVYVNERSAMYYLNHVLPAEQPPAGLTRHTPPRWRRVSTGHEYEWHDARIGALADTAIPPGTSYVGRWQVALLIDGRLSAVTGGLWRASAPSLAWLWMIVVAIACVLAAWRLDRPELHALLARGLALCLLVAIALGIFGRELHGRPHVAAEQLAIALPVLAFAAWGAFRTLTGRAGYILDLIVAFLALWVGSELWPTLLRPFVLTAIPPFLARTIAVVCLGGGVGLLLLAVRKAQHPAQLRTPALATATAVAAVLLLGLSGCGGARPAEMTAMRRPRPSSQAIPAVLLSQARPIGRGSRFRPPPSGPVVGSCSPALEAREDVHVEVFAADRVVIVPAGIGVGSPRRLSAGRVGHARCYGALATLEPTGVVLVRRGASLRLADLFRAWGQPLTRRRVASFTAPAQAHGARGRNGEVAAFVNGRRWIGAPGAVPLSPRAEIVVEIGPRVPPHSSYAFPPGP
jgi:hypothetical protein